MSTVVSAVDAWHDLLRPDVELSADFCDALADRLREARLSFGERVHCPFLRPFFLDHDEVAQLTRSCEALARTGERVVAAVADRPDLLDELGLTDAERRLVAMAPGYDMASTASRVDSFLTGGGLHFAEYNAESPAGLGYTEVLGDIFASLEVMGRFRQRFGVEAGRPVDAMLDALVESYRQWGGRVTPPVIAIVDWRTVPTWPEFEILRDRFEARGVQTIICDPRDLAFDGRRLVAGNRAIDLVYRRVLINDIVERADDCTALVDAYAAGAVCVANTFRCKIPHKKAFFALLTDARFASLFDPDDLAAVALHVPWTRVVREGHTTRGETSLDLVAHIRANREALVMKPNDEYGGAGVTLGWETDEAGWDEVLGHALASAPGAWVVQARIDVRRETFPMFAAGTGATWTDLLVDCAPYVFRGRLAGFLTRLSVGGLANVTSGGGQVPAFVVTRRDTTVPGETTP